nr:MAG TPA: hypothetical protein [Caudoviricetes sp.]
MDFVTACECQQRLQRCGVFMEYDWVGHRDEWILATRADAEKEFDYRCSCD